MTWSLREHVLSNIHNHLKHHGSTHRGPVYSHDFSLESLSNKAFSWMSSFVYTSMSHGVSGVFGAETLSLPCREDALFIQVGLWGRWAGTALFHSDLQYSYGAVSLASYDQDSGVRRNLGRLTSYSDLIRRTFGFCDKIVISEDKWAFDNDAVREIFSTGEDHFWDSISRCAE